MELSILSDNMAKVDLNQNVQAVKGYHVVHLNFPVTELLPDRLKPHLEVPGNVALRECPDIEGYLLDPDDLAFFLRLPLRAGKDLQHDINGKAGSYVDLMDAVSDLDLWPGSSTLDAVSFIYEDDIVYRFCLRHAWTLGSGQESYEKVFEFNSSELHVMLSLASTHPWIGLLHNLIYRSSDRAYFHVKRHLLGLDPAFAWVEEELCPYAWDSETLLSAQDLLARRLKHCYKNSSGNAMTVPVYEAYSIKAYQNAELEIVLPCGHTTTITYEQLRALTSQACLEAHCQVCGKRILTAEDDAHLAQVDERSRRINFGVEQFYWTQFDREIRDNVRVLDISGPNVSTALDAAFESQDMPESFAPVVLRPSRFPEMTKVRKALRGALAEDLSMPPRQLYVGLRDLAIDTFRKANSSNLMQENLVLFSVEAFIHRWITRAVNCEINRGESKAPEPNVGDAIEEVNDVNLSMLDDSMDDVDL